MPAGVNQAIVAIWITIGLSVVAALFNRWIGDISAEEFVGYIFIYALLCIFPYKLSKGSNPARWVFAVFFATSILFMLGGLLNDMPIADWLVSIVSVPITIFALYRLFQEEASLWFQKS